MSSSVKPPAQSKASNPSVVSAWAKGPPSSASNTSRAWPPVSYAPAAPPAQPRRQSTLTPAGGLFAAGSIIFGSVDAPEKKSEPATLAPLTAPSTSTPPSATPIPKQKKLNVHALFQGPAATPPAATPTVTTTPATSTPAQATKKSEPATPAPATTAPATPTPVPKPNGINIVAPTPTPAAPTAPSTSTPPSATPNPKRKKLNVYAALLQGPAATPTAATPTVMTPTTSTPAQATKKSEPATPAPATTTPATPTPVPNGINIVAPTPTPAAPTASSTSTPSSVTPNPKQIPTADHDRAWVQTPEPRFSEFTDIMAEQTPSQDNFSFRVAQWLLDQFDSSEAFSTVSNQLGTLTSQEQQGSRTNLYIHISGLIFQKATRNPTDGLAQLCARLCHSLSLQDIKRDPSFSGGSVHEHMFRLCIDSLGVADPKQKDNPGAASLPHVSVLVTELYNWGLISIAQIYAYLRLLTTSNGPLESRLAGLCMILEAAGSALNVGPWKTKTASVIQWAVNAVEKSRVDERVKTRIKAIICAPSGSQKQQPSAEPGFPAERQGPIDPVTSEQYTTTLSKDNGQTPISQKGDTRSSESTSPVQSVVDDENPNNNNYGPHDGGIQSTEEHHVSL